MKSGGCVEVVEAVDSYNRRGPETVVFMGLFCGLFDMKAEVQRWCQKRPMFTGVSAFKTPKVSAIRVSPNKLYLFGVIPFLVER